METVVGLGFISPMDTVTGKIQARVGEFLQLKAELNDLALTLDPEVRLEVKELMTQQKLLETELPQALKVTEKPLHLGNMFSAYSFGTAMEKQIKDVRDLQKRSQGLPVEPKGINVLTVIKAVAVVLLIRKVIT